MRRTQTLARECGVDEREAVIQLFAAQCGVRTGKNRAVFQAVD
ncbi:MAG: hypothetical protein ACLUI3_13660 [Christensenellales bacterium]